MLGSTREYGYNLMFLLSWKPALLWTDLFIYCFTLCVLLLIGHLKRSAPLKQRLKKVVMSRVGMVSLVVLVSYFSVVFLDSIHFRPAIQQVKAPQAKQYEYAIQAMSLLDLLVSPIHQIHEDSYSAPFALYLLKKRVRLRHVDVGVDDHHKVRHIGILALWAALKVGIFSALCYLFLRLKVQRNTSVAWQSGWLAASTIAVIGAIALSWSHHYHILGTDKVGQDVFYAALKSIRTGWMIGMLSLFIMLPFAVLLGITSGYWSGWVDDVIQYIYTTLSCIPGVLLIAAAVLALQMLLARHAHAFSTVTQRSDIQMLTLCLVLGMTNWTPLCRLLRGETLKLKTSAFVESAVAMGVPHRRIIRLHILPNVMHLILITSALDFSILVLAEAVLSYIGIGVDPSLWSWGNMINAARMELARVPVIWWPLFSAFIFMFVLVFAASLFADTLRNALDPHELTHRQ